MAFSFLELTIYGLSHCTPCLNESRSPLYKKTTISNIKTVFRDWALNPFLPDARMALKRSVPNGNLPNCHLLRRDYH